MPRGRTWNKDELKSLWNAIGSYSIAWIQRHTQSPYDYPNAPKTRSINAVFKKVRTTFGKGGLTRGSWTLDRLLEYTGYSRSQVFRAQRALRQRWQRLGPKGRYLITQEQMEEISGWLMHDYWAKKHKLYGCVWCSENDTGSKGYGLCPKCYYRYRRLCKKLGVPTKLVEQFKAVMEVFTSHSREGEHGRFLETAASRIGSGIALEADQLRRLAHLISERRDDVGFG